MLSRLADDSCTRHLQLADNVSSFGHLMDPCRYVNDNPCRNALGLLGGNDVPVWSSQSDVESELRGQNHESSRCPAYKHAPGETIAHRRLHKPGPDPAPIDASTPPALPTCQILPGLVP